MSEDSLPQCSRYCPNRWFATTDCGEDTCAQIEECDRHAGYSFEDDDEALEAYGDLEELLDHALERADQ